MKVVKILAGLVGIPAFALMLLFIYAGFVCGPGENYECNKAIYWVLALLFGVVGIPLLYFTKWYPFVFISALAFAFVGCLLVYVAVFIPYPNEPPNYPIVSLGGFMIAAFGIWVALNFLPQEIRDAFSDD